MDFKVLFEQKSLAATHLSSEAMPSVWYRENPSWRYNMLREAKALKPELQKGGLLVGDFLCLTEQELLTHGVRYETISSFNEYLGYKKLKIGFFHDYLRLEAVNDIISNPERFKKINTEEKVALYSKAIDEIFLNTSQELIKLSETVVPTEQSREFQACLRFLNTPVSEAINNFLGTAKNKKSLNRLINVLHERFGADMIVGDLLCIKAFSFYGTIGMGRTSYTRLEKLLGSKGFSFEQFRDLKFPVLKYEWNIYMPPISELRPLDDRKKLYAAALYMCGTPKQDDIIKEKLGIVSENQELMKKSFCRDNPRAMAERMARAYNRMNVGEIGDLMRRDFLEEVRTNPKVKKACDTLQKELKIVADSVAEKQKRKILKGKDIGPI